VYLFSEKENFYMNRFMTWAFALALFAGAALATPTACCDDPACCAAGCCHHCDKK
jgi:hypothetical protein